MNKNLITDRYREKLVKYTLKALNKIPKIDHPIILDIGCGTGVPSIALLGEIDDAFVVAVDQDEESLSWFRQKIDKLGFTERLKLIQASFFQTEKYRQKFDLILAEGILHIVGFQSGFLILKEMLENNGYMIIHDEKKDIQKKKNIFKLNNFKIIDCFELDRNIWWNDYFKCLKMLIGDLDEKKLFKEEMNYIREFEKNPEQFESVYFVLKKSN
ncbi:MAG: methyltransferase domain-containing protein [bacterium]